MTKQAVSKTSSLNSVDYSSFDEVNGRHPFKKSCPGSFVDYQARQRKGGKLAYFNFSLAKEMGLITKDHPEIVTKDLADKFLETFSLIIINEFDQLNNRKFPQEEIKTNPYMATKYLQLQHPNKKGTTSGDGRSIWNGVFKRNGKIWDISSCGTGATRLSPATAISKKFFESGDPSISYGCGYSEIDEGISTLMFSEVFHRNNIKTERVLGVIEFSKGIAINVRAHENLLRPSHFFNHLKQSNYDSLKAVTDYYIQRQKANKQWVNVPLNEKDKYRFMLEKITETFAKLSADFEDRYIFCWLDWDGDNILMDGSIIDYGSVRQFGLFHHEYRYDDVQRYSTTILEQKQKAKYIVQTFAQIVDYLLTGKKRALADFSNGKWSDQFEEVFHHQKKFNLAYQIGFQPEQCQFLINQKSQLMDNFAKPFNYFERAKSKQGVTKVEDGINWSAIYCMRDILREFPQILLARENGLEPDEFIEIIRSNYANAEDLEPNNYRNKMIAQFQKEYIYLVEAVGKKYGLSLRETLLNITIRSSVINKFDRVTGDSITTIVNKMISYRPRLKPEQIHQMAQEFSEYQILDPDKITQRKNSGLTKNKLMRSLIRIVRDYREGL